MVGGFAFGQDQYKKVNRFGMAPLRTEGVHNEEQLMDLFNKEPEAISVALGQQDALVKAFLAQMFSAEILYQEFSVGDRFLSLTFRYWKGIGNVGHWEWTGKGSFFGYTMAIECGAKRYWIVVPEICGNIGLWKIETIESTRPVRSMTIVEKEIREWPSRSINKQLPKSEPKPETKPVFPRQAPKQSPQIGYFVDMGVGEFISCRELYGLIGAGARRRIFESTDMVMLIGVGVPIGEDRADWYTVPIIGIGFQSRVFDPFYFGIEAGVSGKMREGLKSQLEFGVEFGFKIKETIGAYLRARAPFDEKIGWNYKIVTGIRIFF